MIVPDSFFKNFLKSFGKEKFTKINVYRVRIKRWYASEDYQNRKQELYEQKCKYMKKAWDSRTKAQKKKWKKSIARGVRKGIKKESKESTRKRGEARIRYYADPKNKEKYSKMFKRLHKEGKLDGRITTIYEKEYSRRINDYAGPITMSELDSL
jgi:hypothetical protein